MLTGLRRSTKSSSSGGERRPGHIARVHLGCDVTHPAGDRLQEVPEDRALRGSECSQEPVLGFEDAALELGQRRAAHRGRHNPTHPAVRGVLLTFDEARAVTAAEAAAVGDVVVLSIPLGKVTTLDPSTLDGMVVVDAMNFWVETDGALVGLETAVSSSHMVAGVLSGARLVKTLNHIGYHDLDTDHSPAGSPARRALAVASDDPEASAVVAEFIDTIGFDVVDAGPLLAGLALEPGTPVFTGVHTRAELAALLGARGERSAAEVSGPAWHRGGD